MDLPKLVQRLGLVALVLVIGLIIFVARQVPRQKTPFLQKSAATEHIVLRKGPEQVDLYRDAKTWQVAVSSGLRASADDDKVKTLLSGLDEVQVEDAISERRGRWDDFEVSPASGTYVGLFGKGGKKLADGIFGKQAPDFSHIYFRYADADPVYLAKGIIRGELGGTTSREWRKKEILSLAESQIKSISVRGPGFTTDLVRTSTDVWTLGGKVVDPAPVYSLVGTLAHLAAEDFSEGPPPTFDDLTYARVTVQTADQTVELRIGSEYAALKRYPVSTGPQAGIAWVAEPKIKSILQKPSAFPPKKS